MNSMKKILVIEDASSDRRRFRIIFEHASLMKYDIEFAWNAQNTNVLGKNETINDLGKRIIDNNYHKIFLDLAWTKRAEDVAFEMQRLTLRDLEKYKDIGIIEGFELLIYLKNQNEFDIASKLIITTGFFSPPVAEFCFKNWGVKAFHKWVDEKNIINFINF